MKILKQLIFTAIISVCGSLTVFAQKDDPDKKTPPKDKPPVVVIRQKDPPEKPKDQKPDDNSNRQKKPEASISGALDLVKIIFD